MRAGLFSRPGVNDMCRSRFLSLALIVAAVPCAFSQSTGAGNGRITTVKQDVLASPPAAPLISAPAMALPSDSPAHPAATQTWVVDGVMPSRNVFWARAEYLQWWIEGMDVPPLLTASPPGTAQAATGVLGAPGTVVLFGDTAVNDESRMGFRLRAGAWLDDSQSWGVETSFFLLEGQSQGRMAGSADGSALIARPFINALTNRFDSELVSFPGVLSGAAAVDASSANLLGFDFLIREVLYRTSDLRLDLVYGYRYLHYRDGVRITENLTALGAPFAPGTQIVVQDVFGASNDFNGGVIGLGGEYRSGAWTMEALLRVDLGRVNREVKIDGSTRTTAPGAAAVVNSGGLLALVSNRGTFKRQDWTFVPELDFTVGYDVSDTVRLTVGWDAIFLTRIARAGNQIDLTVNRNFIPPSTSLAGPASPHLTERRENIWIMGLSIGAEVRF